MSPSQYFNNNNDVDRVDLLGQNKTQENQKHRNSNFNLSPNYQNQRNTSDHLNNALMTGNNKFNFNGMENYKSIGSSHSLNY